MIRSRLEAEGCSQISQIHIVRKGNIANAMKCVAFVQFGKPWYAQCALELDGSVWPEIVGDSKIPISLARAPKRPGAQDDAPLPAPVPPGP
eukprot:1663849-Pyramimonas_sp.AAC.1